MGAGFEIYFTIYTAENLGHAQELFRYMFDIRSAASVYVWDIVYAYDITFRKLMERDPQCNWGLNYHQGWDLFLKEKLDKSNSPFHLGQHRRKTPWKHDQVCWQFNRGKCNYGSCGFEHKCTSCMKGDHGSSNCPMKKEHKSAAAIPAGPSSSGHTTVNRMFKLKSC